MTMEGVLSKGPVVVERRGDDDKMGYIWVLAIIIIFLAVLFIAFKGRAEAGQENLLTGILPLLAAGGLGGVRQEKQIGTENGNGNGGMNGAVQYFQDLKISELLKDQAKDTGVIIHDIDKWSADLRHSMDTQNCTTQKMINDVVINQNRSALESERLYNQRHIDELREQLAKERSETEKERGARLQQETLHAVTKSNCELNSRLDMLFGQLENKLIHIQDKMLTAPKYIPFGGVQAMAPCAPV